MDQKYFRIPFAIQGDKQTIAEEKTANGEVNFTEGWGRDYEKNLYTDAHAKAVERPAMNAVLNAITQAIKQYQEVSVPEWITPANNAGSAFSYAKGVAVRYRSNAATPFVTYISLVDGNTAAPTDITQWQPDIYRESSDNEAADRKNGDTLITPRRLAPVLDTFEQQLQTTLSPFLLPVGSILMWCASPTPPSGWLELNGQAFDIGKNPKLAELFPSGHLPDWRGRFIRGWANGSSVDPESGRPLGSTQEDAIQNIKGGTIASSRWRALDGIHGVFMREPRRWSTSYKDGKHDDWGDYISFDASRVVRTDIETRPKNVAAMFIIKTDKAEAEEGDLTPSAIVVSPAATAVNAGTTQRFTANVLPPTLAQKYPITWSVVNDSLGDIDQNGTYHAKQGVSGNQTIIASISTGLTTTAKVDQYIYATQIILTDIPDLPAGTTAALGITLTPTEATEPLEYASDDASIVGVAEGSISGYKPGRTTLSVTGKYSRVSASKMVTVTEVTVDATYLMITNNLKEIKSSGEDAQREARDNLGLKTLATKDTLTAVDTNAVPLATNTIAAGVNLNTITAPGQYYQNITSNATPELNYPTAVAGILVVYKTGVDTEGCRQVYMPYNSTLEYQRYAYGTPLVFSDWNISGDNGADFTVGEIGGYAFCKYHDDSEQIFMQTDSTWAGADLRYAGTLVMHGYPIPSGTWIVCGAASNTNEATLFRRIA